MAAIDQIININITRSTASVPTVSTTIPLILGSTAPGWADDDYVHAYGNAADLLSDGFTATSPEYLYALALTGQQTVPNEFLVARRASAAEPGQPQIDKFSVKSALEDRIFRFRANGKIYSYTSVAGDVGADILAGLKAAVDADEAALVTASLTAGNGFLVLTAKMDGTEISYTDIDVGLSITSEQPATEAEADALSTTDLNSIQTQNDAWYALILAGATDEEIQTAAAWTQSQRKRLFCNSLTSGMEKPDDETTIAYKLRAGGYGRSVLTHCLAGASAGPHAAWVGGQLPLTPGSNNWAYSTLAGILPDKFTAAQRLALIGNPEAGTKGSNVNIYTEVGGYKIMQMGTNMDGSYIDDGIGVDWLFFNIQSSVYQVLVGNAKTPYTDAGVATLIAGVHSVLDIGVANGLLQPGFTVTAPSVATVPKQQRANRISPTITFKCVLAGAVNAIGIVGNVSI